MMTTKLKVMAIAALLLTVTACGPNNNTHRTRTKVPTATTTLSTHNGPLGEYITTGDGRALYMFTKDKGDDSYCTGNCVKEWPVYEAKGNVSVKGHADNSLVKVHDGKVMYNGHYLYRYFRDNGPNDINGQRLGDSWFLVTPKGEKIPNEQPQPSPPVN